MTQQDEAVSLETLIRATVPRYTSYPTAPHFSAEVGADTYGGFLDRAAAADGPVSLYVHIPFCHSICHYCGCTTKASRRYAPIEAYVEVLRSEIAMVAARIGRRAVSHIHWGGGTPNLLSAAAFEAIVGDFHRFFDVGPTAEHAIELDPRHLGDGRARFLAGIGVNRASLGVQDFDPMVQAAIGRIQPAETVAAAVEQLRDAGISSLSFDLIYGLPEQSVSSIERTVEAAVALAPDRISLFGYAHVPWFRINQKLIDASKLPGSEQRLELERAAHAAIAAAGYAPIGIDHFARPGDPMAVALSQRTLRRNFQGYTTDRAETLIGFGASSIGRTPAGYAQNVTDTGNWRERITGGRLATERGRVLTPEDRLRADVIEQILCFFDADLAATAARHGADPALFSADLDKLAPLVRAGWVVADGGKLAIVRNGAELARLVASAFDAYLGTGGRHSVAV
ncbi:oxygen-independent coproporphyrinogen III oxidase [Pleomorphomonas carboxyditropha]|uniref:Coproporphyrinogen-III oxidase n=1 Tax=Pleomorphomonas carboxyditropha TaxID=2023338 RepID=A0A2G9WNM9_9HYPH|nr:oxygen-independent coproporphyrinogen III oxidase [Pleomorphomonas carboxyditropha]PIO96284.1 oxygen-independent coproporphyrinogen III oxidase [Pleomorphomonas carboxyditropha]